MTRLKRAGDPQLGKGTALSQANEAKTSLRDADPTSIIPRSSTVTLSSCERSFGVLSRIIALSRTRELEKEDVSRISAKSSWLRKTARKASTRGTHPDYNTTSLRASSASETDTYKGPNPHRHQLPHRLSTFRIPLSRISADIILLHSKTSASCPKVIPHQSSSVHSKPSVNMQHCSSVRYYIRHMASSRTVMAETCNWARS